MAHGFQISESQGLNVEKVDGLQINISVEKMG